MKSVPLIFILAIVSALSIFLMRVGIIDRAPRETVQTLVTPPPPAPTLTPTPQPPTLQLGNGTHVFQTFNNCGPAALSMYLSYWGIEKSQTELGTVLRPYQNPQGDNDDKSVTLSELAGLAPEYDLNAYHRPGGSIDMAKRFLAAGIPVITRTLLHADDDIGHFRLLKGYDDTLREFTQDDSLQGRSLKYGYDRYLQLWKAYNFEYLVMVPDGKSETVHRILGENLDEGVAWRNAVRLSESQLATDPDDVNARFNLSVALYHTGDYSRSVAEYERVQPRLPWRTLWYQSEPVLSYYALGRDDDVLRITESVISNQNRAYSELYILRGNIFRKRGNPEAARSEFEKAVLYNRNLKEAKEALDSLRI
jgi:tetratricopeptide (TPR) repeat protein